MRVFEKQESISNILPDINAQPKATGAVSYVDFIRIRLLFTEKLVALCQSSANEMFVCECLTVREIGKTKHNHGDIRKSLHYKVLSSSEIKALLGYALIRK